MRSDERIGYFGPVILKDWRCDGAPQHFCQAPEKPIRCPFVGCGSRDLTLASPALAKAWREEAAERWKAEKRDEQRQRLER